MLLLYLGLAQARPELSLAGNFEGFNFADGGTIQYKSLIHLTEASHKNQTMHLILLVAL